MGQRDWASYVGRPQTEKCSHDQTVSTVTAGLERVACETCGHVSIRYQESTVRIWQAAPVPGSVGEGEPNVVIDLTTQPQVRMKRCGSCGSTAVYYTPRGLACSKHAWEAASAQEVLGTEFWIPVLIDR